jgi:NADH pyrophosphatase NudC (nudix superfamily)
MKPFRFCPACGNALEHPDNEGGAQCPSCERSWYRNSAPTVGCVIVREGKALVTVRGREPEKGRLDVPGGFLMAGEHPVDGLKREVKEELGIEIDVDIGDCLSMVPHRYGKEGDFVLALGFAARFVSGEVTPTDDVKDVVWVGPDQLDELDWAWPHDRELVRMVLEREESR